MSNQNKTKNQKQSNQFISDGLDIETKLKAKKK